MKSISYVLAAFWFCAWTVLALRSVSSGALEMAHVWALMLFMGISMFLGFCVGEADEGDEGDNP